MKIIVHFCVFVQNQISDKIQEFLVGKSVVFEKSDYLDDRIIISFDVDESSDNYESVFKYINEFKPTITKRVYYSKSELKKSQWLTVLCYWGKIDLPTDEAYNQTFSDYCIECKTKEQIDSYRIKSVPVWKKHKNFCADTSGGWDKLFCSEYAKNVLEANEIKGVDFIPVLHYKTLKPINDLYQLQFENFADPLKINVFPKPIKEDCSSCGKARYTSSTIVSEISFNQNSIVTDVDAFIVPVYTNGCKLIVVSNKLYRVLKDELHENTLDFKPIKIIDIGDGSVCSSKN